MKPLPIPVAIVGLGRTGWNNHAFTLARMPSQYKIVAASDPESVRRMQAESTFKCTVFETFEQLLATSEPRLIVIASPNHLHCEQTIQALQAGKDVICEKPMAPKVSEVDAMIRAEKETKRLLTIFQNSRYAEDFEKVREVLASGVLGRIIQIRIRWSSFGRRWDWQTLRRFGGGTLNNTLPHPLDQILSLFPMENPEVFCHCDQALSLGDAEDHVKILLRKPGFPLIDIEASSADAHPGPLWTVLGTQGHLQGDSKRLNWQYFDPQLLPARVVSQIPSSDLAYNQETLPWVMKEWVAPSDSISISQRFYERLHNAITHNLPPDITSQQVRRTMCLIERCQQLHQQQVEVR